MEAVLRRWGGRRTGVRPMRSRELLAWCRERRGQLAAALVLAERLPAARVLRAVAERLEIEGDDAGRDALRAAARERESVRLHRSPAPANGDFRRLRIHEDALDGQLYVRVPVSTMYGLLGGDLVEARFRHDVVMLVRCEVAANTDVEPRRVS